MLKRWNFLKTGFYEGINYDLVDINVEVFRMFNEQFVRIIEPLLDAEGGAGIPALAGSLRDGEHDAGPIGGVPSVASLRRLFLPSGVEKIQADAPPDFPLRVDQPKVYYLYVGPSR